MAVNWPSSPPINWRIAAPRRGLAFGVDQVGHGLGLVQGKLAVQESAAGEFTGTGGTRTGRPAGRHDHPRGHSAAVTKELHGVFAGVTAGAAHGRART